MSRLLPYVKQCVEELDLCGAENVKIVSNMKVKYKVKNKWYANEIKNFDKYRDKAYRSLETILRNMFENVGMVEEETPIICEQKGELRYLPQFSIKDKVLTAERLKPQLLKKYPGLDAENAKFTAFYIGNGRVILIYEDRSRENPYGAEIIKDIANLHSYAFRNKLKEEDINKVFREYFKHIFAQPNPTYPETPIKKDEAPQQLEAGKANEIGGGRSEELEAEKGEKPREDLEEEELPPLEKIWETEYEEVRRTVEEYNPPTNEFFARAAKIEYEKSLIGVRDSRRRVEADYILYWFIKCYGKTRDKQKLLKKFYEEIRVRMEPDKSMENIASANNSQETTANTEELLQEYYN